jgi:hypothetical protein
MDPQIAQMTQMAGKVKKLQSSIMFHPTLFEQIATMERDCGVKPNRIISAALVGWFTCLTADEKKDCMRRVVEMESPSQSAESA